MRDSMNRLRLIVAPLSLIGLLLLGTPSAPAGASAGSITATWAQASPSTSPAASSGDVMAAVPGGHLLMVEPGRSGGASTTWQWDGLTWTQQVTTVNPAMPSAMAYNAKLGKIVLVDPNYQKTYVWTGADWSLLLSGQGPSTGYGAMAYDQNNGQLVYFGGYVSQSVDGRDTWTFDGSSWTQQHPSVSPPGRMMALAQDDPVSGKVILFSGFSEPGQANYSDTWQWDGSTWTQLHPSTTPSPRNSSTSFVDQRVQRFFIEGGVTDGGI
ncbi:MAG: kelch repeat-containing protein, partial [Actinomycetes bacterium]